MKLFCVEAKRNDWTQNSETLRIVARSLPAAVKEVQTYMRIQRTWLSSARIISIREDGEIHRAQR